MFKIIPTEIIKEDVLGNFLDSATSLFGPKLSVSLLTLIVKISHLTHQGNFLLSASSVKISSAY